METGFETVTTWLDGRVCVLVIGEVDIVTCARLDAALAEATAQADGRRVEVDLTEVTYFGTEGARSLRAAWDHARDRHVELSVVAATPMTRRVLEILDLGRLLPAEQPMA